MEIFLFFYDQQSSVDDFEHLFRIRLSKYCSMIVELFLEHE